MTLQNERLRVSQGTIQIGPVKKKKKKGRWEGKKKEEPPFHFMMDTEPSASVLQLHSVRKKKQRKVKGRKEGPSTKCGGNE